MAVFIDLDLNELNNSQNFYLFDSFTPITSGVSDSVFLVLSNKTKFILKIYNSKTKNEILDEIKIINTLKQRDLKIASNISDIFIYKNQNATIFEYINGHIVSKVENIHLKEIAYFLSQLHKIELPKFQKEYLLTKDTLKNEILKTQQKIFFEKFDSIKNLDFETNTLLHTDLFIDNAIFDHDKLNSVIDFSDFAFGDRYYDLAIVILSWCFKDNIINKALMESFINNYESYSKILISKNKLTQMLKFASLRVSVNRYTSYYIDNNIYVKDYKEYLDLNIMD